MRKSWMVGLAAVLMIAAGAQAKVYKWTDEDGRVHYGSQPPAVEQAQELKLRKDRPSAPAPQAADQAKDNAEQRSEESAKIDQAMQENCKAARTSLAIYENPANRRFREEGKAEPVYYTDEQRQAKINELKSYLGKHCSQ